MQKAPYGAFGGLFSGPNWIRTNDRLLRRQLLYPTELWGQNPVKKMSGWQDSNLRPPAPKAGAIPGYATPRKKRYELNVTN